MRSILEKLVSLGVTQKLPIPEAMSLRFTNVLSMLTAFVFLFFVGFAVSTGYVPFIIAAAAAMLCLIAVPVLTSRNMHLPARIVFAVVSIAYIVFSSLYRPTSDYSPIFFYCCMAAAFLVFPPSEKVTMWLVETLIVACFILVILISDRKYFNNPGSRLLVPDSFSALAVFIGLGMIYRYFMIQYEREVKGEQDKVEALLQNILPDRFIERLKEQPGLVFESHHGVSVINVDIVDFTVLAGRVEPERLITILNRVFSFFDEVAERFGLEKIKTVGDAYVAVAGIESPGKDHVRNIVAAALEMLKGIKEITGPDGSPLRLRIGIGLGDAMTGVIGQKKFAYSIWGEAVTCALAMEHSAPDGGLRVSNGIYEQVPGDFMFEYGGEIPVSGVPCKTWILKAAHT